MEPGEPSDQPAGPTRWAGSNSTATSGRRVAGRDQHDYYDRPEPARPGAVSGTDGHDAGLDRLSAARVATTLDVLRERYFAQPGVPDGHQLQRRNTPYPYLPDLTSNPLHSLEAAPFPEPELRHRRRRVHASEDRRQPGGGDGPELARRAGSST